MRLANRIKKSQNSCDLNHTLDGLSGGTGASVAANFGYEQQNPMRQKTILK